MKKSPREWTVHPHRPLRALDDNLWIVEGELPNMPIGRLMALVRRHDGTLLVHNPIAVDEVARREIEALGSLRWVVVPNGFHRLDAPAWQARYPEARFFAPRGARARVEKVVRVDGAVEEIPADPAVRFEYVDGMKPFEALMWVRSAGGSTLVAADLLMNQPPYDGLKWQPYNWTGAVGGPRVPPLVKLFALRDRRAAAASLERLATIPDLRRVLVAHRNPFDAAALVALARSPKLRA